MDIFLIPGKLHRQLSSGDIVFDAVFHQIEYDLVKVVFQDQHGSVSGEVCIHSDFRLRGQSGQHPFHLPDRGGQVDDLRFRINIAVDLGQGQKLGGHAVQPLRLVADIADEFPDGFGIHVVLQNGVGKQLDGGQRGLQLMGRVGYKPAALLLGGLEPVCQVVEFVAEDSQLIAAAHVYLVRIVALLNDAHGIHDPAHPAGEGAGKGNGEQQHNDLQDQGDPQDRILQGQDQVALYGIVFHHVYAADHGAEIQDRGSHMGLHGAVLILPGENILALNAPDDLREQTVLSHGKGGAVVKDQTAAVGDDDTLGILDIVLIVQNVHLPDGGGDGIGIEDLQL